MAQLERNDAPVEIPPRGRARPVLLSFLPFLPLLPLALFPLFYSLRGLDDNRLVSWRWVFSSVDAGGVFIALVLATGLAYMLSNIKLPGPGGLFVLSVLTSALFTPVPEVIIDSSRYFTQAKHLSQYGAGYFMAQWGHGIEAWTDLPLMPLIYGAGFSLFGEHRAVSQCIVILMLGGAVYFTAMLGRETLGRRAGSLAGIFLLSMPYLYTQAPLMMVDIPSMFFLVFSVWALRRALVHGGPWIPLASLAFVLALFTKYSLWVMLSIAVPVLLVVLPGRKRLALVRSSGVFLLFLMIALPPLWHFRDIVASQIELLNEYQRPGLNRWHESLFSTFFFHVSPIVTICAIISIPLGLRRREAWLMPFSWLLILILLVLGVERIRYTLPLFPMLALMASYPVSMIEDQRARRGIAYAVFLCSFVLAVAAYAPFLQNNSLVNLKHAGERMDSLGAESLRVLTLPQNSVINPDVAVPILDLYTDASIYYAREGDAGTDLRDASTSSFRFTWTYRNPQYYTQGGMPERMFTLVISPDIPSPHLPELQGMELVEKYDINEGLYKFRPHPYIYKKSH